MYIKTKVRTGSKEDKIIARSLDHFDIWVKDKPERNKANLKVIHILSQYLGVDAKYLRIIKGRTSQSKIINCLKVL